MINLLYLNSPFRILAVGWDQQVTEFNDVEGREYGDPKKWPMFHADDITCADVKLGEGVVTATYSGELIFWKLETGQPYRRYSVAHPNDFIELKYNRGSSIVEDDKIKEAERLSSLSVSHYVRKSISVKIREVHKRVSRRSTDDYSISEEQSFDMDQHALAPILSQAQELPMSVQAVLFLQTRPMTREHGNCCDLKFLGGDI